MYNTPHSLELQRNFYSALTQFFENIEETFDENEPITIYPENLRPIQKMLEQIKAEYR